MRRRSNLITAAMAGSQRCRPSSESLQALFDYSIPACLADRRYHRVLAAAFAILLVTYVSSVLPKQRGAMVSLALGAVRGNGVCFRDST